MKSSLLSAVAAAALIAALPASAQETRSFTDDAGRTVEVPSHPQRIVTLHDSSLTTPLIELGIMPVGAFSRSGEDGPYMRGAATLTGVTFANSGIVDVGGSPADLEAIAALEPDLIITAAFQQTPLDQLQSIAPTVVVEDDMRGQLASFEGIAALTGTEDRLDILKSRYESQIDQIRNVLAGRDISASIILTQEGQIAAWHTYGVLGKVLRDAGFSFPPVVDAVEGSEREFFSGEELQAFDADFMFLTYDAPRGMGPADAIAELATLTPSFCQFLTACAGERLVLLPREDAVARSYTAAGMMASAVLAAISGRHLDALAQ
ncbi:MAG TPA: ABC transporter substrate-binding protein [Pelagibacterium sp.]|uniref:ABC transporter substrate-binding protein n=1 Tax=Pelagibacterium sp. TaxID=1967288 RepID=UPI002CF1590E|nr:ABC transporter substrate-binding protein [Pelagibacterium sp.]HWJ87463.1 ABC transporter substrate-binding protein [Pelagibacterium sp.]